MGLHARKSPAKGALTAPADPVEPAAIWTPAVLLNSLKSQYHAWTSATRRRPWRMHTGPIVRGFLLRAVPIISSLPGGHWGDETGIHLLILGGLSHRNGDCLCSVPLGSSPAVAHPLARLEAVTSRDERPDVRQCRRPTCCCTSKSRTDLFRADGRCLLERPGLRCGQRSQASSSPSPACSGLPESVARDCLPVHLYRRRDILCLARHGDPSAQGNPAPDRRPPLCRSTGGPRQPDRDRQPSLDLCRIDTLVEGKTPFLAWDPRSGRLQVINDIYGNAVGDRVLCEVVDRLGDRSGHDIQFGRIGATSSPSSLSAAVKPPMWRRSAML